jgi:NAD-dependent DNA ligase
MDYNFIEINKDPSGFIKKNKKKDIINLLLQADDVFFNGENTLLKDDIYDIIKDYIRKKYPKDTYLQRVGADVDNKVTLPYYMGSQNKIKDSEEEITKYQKKYSGSYVISDKLDGVSCLIVYTKLSSDKSPKNKYYPYDIKLYTRGNGTEGQDISHLLEYINGFPNIKNIKDNNLAVRGELIISKNNWEKLKTEGENGANPRNTVSGAINSKTLNKKILNKIDFVAYTLINPNISNGLPYLKELKFIVVNNNVVNSINLNLLSESLQKSRNNEYIIDGIVISDISKPYNIEKGKNPEHSFAFKSIHTLEQVEVIVREVEWNVSKDKYMKPIVKFDEIKLDDVKIKQATGFNASFIFNNVIGAGSRIIIIRSGNVIPHINNVLSHSASGIPSMPGELDVNYKWNDTHVDIIMIDSGKTNSEYNIKNIMYFMKTSNIEYMGQGNITKIYNAGFHTIKEIININKKELMGIEGFKDKSSDNILASLKKIKDIDCLVLMDASNMLGRGFSYKKIKMITDIYPQILINDIKNRNISLKITVDDLKKVDGIAVISAKAFIENLPKFYDFYDSLGIKCKSPKTELKEVVLNTNFKDKSFVFSGFRNKELEKIVVDNGGKVNTTISKNTNYLIVKNKEEISTKIDKAKALAVTILDIEDFEKFILM